jgi:hypothetical protein
MPDVPADEETAETFLAKAAARDPERYAVLCAKYPLLTDRQLARRSSRELPLSPSNSEDRVPKTNGKFRQRPGNRSPEFWAAYYGFEFKETA